MLIEVSDSRRNSSDRFIPRRAHVNFDLSYHTLTEANDEKVCSNVIYSGTDWFTNTAKYFYNLEQYRTNLWKAMMPKENKVLVFSSPKKRTKFTKEENGDGGRLWPSYPRSRPLLGPPSVILDMPDLDTNISHQVVDWGKKGYIGTIYKKEVHLWHPEDNSRRHVTNTGRRVQSCLKWNVDGTELAMAVDKAGIAVWNFTASKTTEVCRCVCPENNCVVTAMHFTTTNYLVTGCSAGRLCVWSPWMVCVDICYPAHMNGIIAVKFSCKENYVVTTGLDRRVRMWKWPHLQPLFEITFSEAPVRAVAWHPWRDSLLAIGGPDNTTLWNASTLKPLEVTNHPHDNSLLDSLTFNPLSGELVASYYVFGDNGTGFHLLSVLKDLEHIVDEALFHEGRVPYLLWDASGTKLATASADENLCIWDFFGSSNEIEKRYLNLSKKKALSTDMLKNLNIFNSCIR